MLLKDMSGVVQESSKASKTTASGKLPEARNLVVSDSIISERVLLTPPLSQPMSSISQPILLPPPTETPIIEHVTENPKVYETQLQQQ